MKKIEMLLPELPYAIEEALNRLRINIKFCGKNTKRILITSSVPNEGKSFITVQLWRLLAEAGFPTVMLDLDLRKSVLKTRHDMKLDEEVKGLDYYLSGQSEYEEVVYETNVENGYIVPCTTHLENPTTLFEDSRFKELLEKLGEEYRYVLIDTPPLINVSDGTQIAAYCDGAILVVRSGYTSKKLIKESMNQLKRAKCKLLGTVLNRVDTSGSRYGKYYGYNKYYRYGYYNRYYQYYGENTKDGDGKK